MKVAVVGGGSTYTPELVDGVARLTGALKVTELVLVDPDETPARRGRAGVGPDHARVRAPGPGQLDGQPGRRRSTGPARCCSSSGSAARPPGKRDETWPLDCGCVGQETTGAGGLAKALRTVPDRAGHRRAGPAAGRPGAWIIDFTNPVGIVTRALLDAGHRAVGLCNVAIGFQRLFARLLGTDPAAVRAGSRRPQPPDLGAGRLVDGTDRLPGLIAAHGEEIAEHTGLPASVLHELGAVPVLLPALLLRARRGGGARSGPRPTRAEEVAEIERELLAHVRRPGPGPQARAAVRARRRVLLRGGGGPARLAGQRHRGHPGGQRPERGHVPVPARRRGDRGARGDRRGRRPPGAGRAAAAADARADRARVRVRGTGRGRRPAGRPGPGPRRAAGPSPGRPDRPGRRGWPTGSSPRTRPSCPGRCRPGRASGSRDPAGTPGELPGAALLSWPSTAGTARPTSPWWPRTGRCSPRAAVPGCARSPPPPVLAAIGAVIGAAALDAGLPGGWPVARTPWPAWPTPTCPRKRNGWPP